jgi:pyridoxal phosphate enzyme (YggS family)
LFEDDIWGNFRDLTRRVETACARVGRSPQQVSIVAVTKTVEPARVLEAFRAGVRCFGENKVQEAAQKLPLLRDGTAGATWSMVGHLQSNKVRSSVDLFDSIDSIDSIRLAGMVDQCARARMPVLLQVNVSAESTKQGFSVGELHEAVSRIGAMPNLDLKGLMTMAPLAHNPEDVRLVFRQLRQLKDSLGLVELSMGTSDDFEVAVEEGATMLRIGRALFGKRK